MDIRNDWTLAEVQKLFALPFMDLIFAAQQVHRRFHVPNTVQVSTLLSVKTGACPEDCAYCPQSAPYRSPKPKDLRKVLAMIRAVKSLGMETCATLGMLTAEQAHDLKAAGLDYYNHNLDTSPEYYEKIITTRTYQDRLDTLQRVREAGLSVCCGGIVGMGEQPADRAALLHVLATLPAHPDSVPINQLVRVKGTPLEQAPALDPFDFVRTVAVARILMPRCHVRLSAGRGEMSDELQALCFLAGANSIFYGEKLLTTGNPDTLQDQALFERLKLIPEASIAAPA